MEERTKFENEEDGGSHTTLHDESLKGVPETGNGKREVVYVVQ